MGSPFGDSNKMTVVAKPSWDTAVTSNGQAIFGSKPIQEAVKQQSSFYTPLPNSFPTASSGNKSLVLPKVAVQNSDIEKLGDDIGKQIGQTTEKIVAKMGVGKFEELGNILVDVQNEVYKLDPTSVSKTGISGWIQRNFGNIKKELTLRVSNADKVFADLSTKISNHIAIHSDWIKDLDKIYDENFRLYNAISATITTGENMKTSIESSLSAWPDITADDPDAAMKLQNKRDVESLLKETVIKLDLLFRWKTVTESNAPKIRSQQETSKATVNALKNVISFTIPMVKSEFALFMQTLDAQKSIQVVNASTNLANTTLVKSADSAKNSAIESAKALNNPVITTETLMHIKNRMLETVKEVKQIDSDAQKTRIQDKAAIEQSQKDYLKELTSSPIIYGNSGSSSGGPL